MAIMSEHLTFYSVTVLACMANSRWPTAKAIARSWAESPCTCAKFSEIPETDRPTD